ncbi:hypothetical protein [Thiolapillus sp.]|uniref:hypothetical protein n=1 Tax=Thiolapillus sp. TaxID=2017437 RepID=UPI003AF50C42
MFQQTLDVFEIPAQVLELLLDAFAPHLGRGAFLLGNGQIRFTRFLPTCRMVYLRILRFALHGWQRSSAARKTAVNPPTIILFTSGC